MKRACLLIGMVMMGAAASGAPRSVTWAKHVIDTELPAISAVCVDVNGDGTNDVVAAGGPSGSRSRWSNLVFWYQGPGWEKRPVCQLRERAVILHLGVADLTTQSGASPSGAPAVNEIIVDDGHFGEIWRYGYDRKNGTWTGSLFVTNVVGAHGTATGDIDRDGYADLLVPSQMGIPFHGVVWARNPGRRDDGNPMWEKFPLAESFTIKGWQEYVQLADLNGDGRLDALHGSDGKDGWMGYWLQGKDPRGPWEGRRLAGPMAKATNIDAADFNGDGKPDIVGTEGHGTGIWWFPAPDYPPLRVDDTLKSVHDLAVGDFNGDGVPDVAACGFASKEAAWFLNDGRGRFTKMSIDTNQCAYDARAADLDKDGDLDILLSGQNSSNLVWYENQSLVPARP